MLKEQIQTDDSQSDLFCLRYGHEKGSLCSYQTNLCWKTFHCDQMSVGLLDIENNHIDTTNQSSSLWNCNRFDTFLFALVA